MSELCGCGSGKEMKGFGKFGVSYKGIGLYVTRTGSECENCSFNRRNIIESIDKYGEDLIIKPFDSSPNFSINWDFYCKFMEKEHSEDQQSLNDILVALEILSVDPENNWEITANGSLGLSPRYHSSILYFRKECDVIEYAKRKFSDTLYHWDIRRISRVIRKSDIIK